MAEKAKAKKEPKAKKEVKLNPCLCGCGDESKGHFVQGHDGRVKGWIAAGTKGKFKEDGPKATVESLLKKHENGHPGLQSSFFKEAFKAYAKAKAAA